MCISSASLKLFSTCHLSFDVTIVSMKKERGGGEIADFNFKYTALRTATSEVSGDFSIYEHLRGSLCSSTCSARVGISPQLLVLDM